MKDSIHVDLIHLKKAN